MFKTAHDNEVVTKKTTFGRSSGIEFIREEADWDTHDAWASLRSFQFDIAEAWYGYADERLPGYCPAAGFQDDDWESDRSARLYEAMMHEIVTRDDVEYWWSVLDRMETLVVQAGRDY